MWVCSGDFFFFTKFTLNYYTPRIDFCSSTKANGRLVTLASWSPKRERILWWAEERTWRNHQGKYILQLHEKLEPHCVYNCTYIKNHMIKGSDAADIKPIFVQHKIIFFCFSYWVYMNSSHRTIFWDLSNRNPFY